MTTSDQHDSGMFEDLIDGFKACLEDIWTLEVNTSVVSEIGGYKFNPISCYESIFSLPKDLEEFKISLPLDDYMKLRELRDDSEDSEAEELFERIRGKLDDNVKLPVYVKTVFKRKMLPADLNSTVRVYEVVKSLDPIERLESTMRSYVLIRDRLSRAYKSLRIKSEMTVDSPEGLGAKDESIYELPSLDHALRDGLLEKSSFLRELRSLRELYYLVGGQDATNSNNINDLISAQTVIQMDGDVMNRFHMALFSEEKEKKDFLVQTHQAALSIGQENWKSLVNLIIHSLNTLSGILKGTFR